MNKVSSEVANYINNHSIDTKILDKDIEIAISSLVASNLFFSKVVEENSNHLSQTPIGGIAVAMMRRVYAYADSALLLFLSHQLPASGILSRTTCEAAINLMYILNDDTDTRLMIYFEDYYFREMKELTRWEQAAKSLKNGKESAIHLLAIKTKREQIETLPKLFSQIFTVDFPKSKIDFPSVAARFKALDREIEYETIFTELSTQVHNSPEDLIIQFVTNAASMALGTDLFKVKLEEERLRYAKVLSCRSIGYYVEAIISFFIYFHLDSLIPTAKNYLTELEKIYASEFSRQSN
jgi:hypothetical protein